MYRDPAPREGWGPAPRSLWRSVLFAALVAVMGTVLGCSSSEECRFASDCPAAEQCIDGFCVAECREDRDCPRDKDCQAGVCVERVTGQRLCATALDCEVGQTCANGVCSAVRFVRPDAGVDPAPTPAPDAGSGPVEPVDAGVAPDAGPLVDGGVALPYGAICARASDCESGFCLAAQGETSGRCTQPCASDGDCFYPDTCLEVPGSATRLCGTSMTGRPAGAPCPGGPSECATGLCVDTSDGNGPFCTQQCSPLPSCPPNLTCQPIRDGQGGAVPVCIRGQGGGFGEACSASSDCATTLCVEVGSGGVCTSLCAQVPCPAGWSCTEADDAGGRQLRVCAPDGALGGRFGDACTGASSCQSNLCLFDPFLQFAFCTERCASNADCSSIPGLSCVQLPTGDRVCAAI